MVDRKNEPDRSSDQAPAEPEYNGWRVLHFFLEKFFGLINTNKIFPVFILLLFAIIGLIIWRLPGSELADLLRALINKDIVNEVGLVFALVATNLAWVFIVTVLTLTYQREINRLSEERKKLFHQPDRSSIEEHRSSEGKQRAVYLFQDENQSDESKSNTDDKNS